MCCWMVQRSGDQFIHSFIGPAIDISYYYVLGTNSGGPEEAWGLASP